jgi:hypothetical protein
LAPLRSLLSRLPVVGGLHLSQLELALAAHGTVVGLVPDDLEDGSLPVRPSSALAATFDGTLQVQARGVRWQTSDRVIATPSASLRLELRTTGPRPSVEGTMEADELHLLAGAHRIDASDVSTKASATLDGDLQTGEAELALRLSARSVLQDFAAYPVGDLALTLSAHRTADGVVRISSLQVENPAGGTSLALQGGLDLGFERRRLSLRGQLKQDLSRAWKAPETFEGRGLVGLTFRVESSDLTVFRTQAALRLEDVHVRLPRADVALESVDGEIPISADVAVDGQSVTLLRGAELNPFSLHRFADQHPLLSRSSFLSVGSIASPAVSIAPLAGNLKIEQNVVSLGQLEMGYRGGHVSGECVLDWDGEDSTLGLHVRAVGVRSSHGEPFDGNAALLISASERSIDGRIEILRIGSRHLLDLLDVQDPLRVDPATNRIRGALAFGYPDRARVQFDHGFASMRVTFGGLARFLSVGDLRGIPTGPLIDKMLAPFSKWEPP